MRVDAQRVDIRLHQTAERSIYHPMSLQSLGAGESPRDDSDAKVTTPILSSRMTCVPVAVVDDLELVRCECLLESSSDHGDAFCGHGRTLSTASMSTSPNTPYPFLSASLCGICREIQMACMTTVTSNKPSCPQTLKATHVAWS